MFIFFLIFMLFSRKQTHPYTITSGVRYCSRLALFGFYIIYFHDRIEIKIAPWSPHISIHVGRTFSKLQHVHWFFIYTHRSVVWYHHYSDLFSNLYNEMIKSNTIFLITFNKIVIFYLTNKKFVSIWPFVIIINYRYFIES